MIFPLDNRFLPEYNDSMLKSCERDGFFAPGTKESGDHRLKVTAVPANGPTTREERA